MLADSLVKAVDESASKLSITSYRPMLGELQTLAVTPPQVMAYQNVSGTILKVSD